MISWILLSILFFNTLNLSMYADAQVDDTRFTGSDMMTFINYYRCMHGTQPLAWDNCLAAKAQQWANNRGAAQCVMQHSGYPGLGECVAAGTWRGLTGYNAWPSDVSVDSGWYHEPWVYNSATTQYNHFSQLVWQGTTHIGCAWVPCANISYEFWVCQFTPAGNILDVPTINANVPMPCRSQAQCNFVLQGMDLTVKFADTTSINTALAPNQINTSTYSYTSQTCLTPLSKYPGYPGVTNSGPICQSTPLPSTALVNIANTGTSGSLSCSLSCSSGTLSGSSTMGCNSDGSWSVSANCGGVTAPPQTTPPSGVNTGSASAPASAVVSTPAPAIATTPAPTPSPSASACWSTIVTNTYLSSYPANYVATSSTLAQAQAQCLTLSDCGGVTQEVGGWECRKGTNPITSGTGENSYVRKASCGTQPAPAASPSPSPSPSPIAQPTIATTGITFGSGFIFRPSLGTYVLGPKLKQASVFVTPSILTDIVPTGTLTLKDTLVSTTTTMNATLTTGKVTFTFTYGPAKTGIHTWAIAYSGDRNFAPTSSTITVLFYNGLTSGHYVISQTVATVGSGVYFFGPAWEVYNGFPNVNFNGLVLDTTTAACGNTFQGYQSNATNTLGPYLGAYVVNSLTQTIANSGAQAVMGSITEIAIIRMNANAETSVGLTAPGTGTILDVYCPANF